MVRRVFGAANFVDEHIIQLINIILHKFVHF